MLIRCKVNYIIIVLLFLVIKFKNCVTDKPCAPRKFNHTSVVCVCNSTYCDETSPIKPPGKNKFLVYSTSLEGLRLKKSIGNIQQSSYTKFHQGDLYQIYRYVANIYPTHVRLRINRNRAYQKIHGFGASFTDSSAINLLKLSKNTQKYLLNSLFGKTGMEYNIGRVPIGASDCSVHPYAYNEYPVGDTKLTNFSLTMEDFEYKIPLIKNASKIATDKMLLIASSWSPPIWMKTNNNWRGPSRLKKKYYQTYADYHVRFLEEYEKNNVTFWAITTGNEPSAGIANFVFFNTLGWLVRDMAVYVENHFGPTIRNSKYSKIIVMGLDDTRQNIPWWIDTFAENKKAFEYIDAFATHWYMDFFLPIHLIDGIHESYPDRFLITTEVSSGMLPWEPEKVALGSWARAEVYAKRLIDYFNHWYTGWVDWNIALDMQGGPNWDGNFIDANVIVVPENDEFYKQPMFYAYGHFTKFIPRNSVKIHVDMLTGFIATVAFKRPDDGIVVIFYNENDFKVIVSIEDPQVGLMEVTVPKKSIHTVLYW